MNEPARPVQKAQEHPKRSLENLKNSNTCMPLWSEMKEPARPVKDPRTNPETMIF